MPAVKRRTARGGSLALRAGVAAVCLSGWVLAPVPAAAFDTGSPAPQAIAPNALSPTEALRSGARKYYAGDKEGALMALRYAAENGQPMAAWKLGEMYASGDGVQEDDVKAFEYYSQIVREHGDDRPDDPDAPFVSSAFVALGTYYMNGINGVVPKNISRARQIFTHAASYFGDADAQYHLGRLYQGSSDRLAVRWYNLAAIKGHVPAQARLGETLYAMGSSEDRQARGLMWMTVARKQAFGADTDWINALHEQYFALASEPVRTLARGMAENWIENNRPDIVAARQQPVQ
ncbi:tetratricopeptide repeat protein [Roseibium aquae]|uniref:tetratricopeptide repeat protein n=1 Tax=Roseibium aquae TaxID=1323746 RepID=UPI001FCAB8C8|nr:tetratricopeptide repeat protein [Roseibium aquae]